MDEILKYMQAHIPVYFAATDGEKATVRPYGFNTIFEGKPTFVSSPVGRFSQLTPEHPHVEGSCCDAAGGTFLRISGKVAPITEKERIDQLIKENPRLEIFGGHMYPFSLVDGKAEIIDFRTGEAKVSIDF